MTFTWAGALQLALQLTLAFVNWQRERGLIEAGRAEAIAANLKVSNELLAEVDAARTRVDDAVRADPDSVRDDDGHRRD